VQNGVADPDRIFLEIGGSGKNLFFARSISLDNAFKYYFFCILKDKCRRYRPASSFTIRISIGSMDPDPESQRWNSQKEKNVKKFIVLRNLRFFLEG
jgi:hypothetical protein